MATVISGDTGIDKIQASVLNTLGSYAYNGGTTIGNLRIQTGTATTPSTSTDAGTAEGLSARYYNVTTVALTGFASTPTVFASVVTNYHETTVGPVSAVSSSSVSVVSHAARTAAIQSKVMHYIAIGEAS